MKIIIIQQKAHIFALLFHHYTQTLQFLRHKNLYMSQHFFFAINHIEGWEKWTPDLEEQAPM